MTKIQRLERDIMNLPPKELAAFRKWFEGYDSALWDQQLEQDIVSGKLTKLAEKALADHTSGKTKEI